VAALKFAVTFWVLVLCIDPAKCLALVESGSIDHDLKFQETTGPYCGVLAMTAALNACGVRRAVTADTVRETVSKDGGSTAADLISYAYRSGVSAVFLRSLTLYDLQSLDTAAVLHVRSGLSVRAPDHWIAYLGTEGTRCRVFDPGIGVVCLTHAELLGRWNGHAVLLNRRLAEVHFARIPLLLCTALIGLVARQWRATRQRTSAPRFKLLGRMAVEWFSLPFMVLFVVLGFHVFAVDGCLRNRAVVAEIQRRYYVADAIEISMSELKGRIGLRDYVLIDARAHSDFEAGTIPGARSIPPSSGIDERVHALRDVTADAPIVVFCQSRFCPYAVDLAGFLTFNGFSNVTVLGDGYSAWESEVSK